MKKNNQTARVFKDKATKKPADNLAISNEEWAELFAPFSTMCALNPIGANADASRATLDLQNKGYTL